MDNRAAIPALALLGLSFTGCTNKGELTETIVGDWRAVEIDGEKRPTVESGDGTVARYGFQLIVEDELDGDLAYYTDIEYGALTERREYGGDLMVDDADAPKYRIVVDDFIGLLYEDYSDYNESVGPGYGTGGDPGYGTTGALLDDLARPIAAPREPGFASPTFTLACTLAGDTLTCDREGAEDDEALRTWVFARHKPDGS